MPALRALERAFDDHRRVLAAPGALEPLVALLGGWWLHHVPAQVGGGVPSFGALPRADVAVNLHGVGPQSTAALRATGAGRVIALDARGADGGHEVERWCRLLERHGIAADPRELLLPVPAVEPRVRGAVVLHPGAASGARRWPVERWAAVARDLPGPLVVTGSAGERVLAEAVGTGTVLAGTTSLLELAALVAHARLVLSADTGVAHLAAAFDRPAVTLFGPTAPARWGPPPDRPHHAALWRGRVGDPHGDEPDPGLLAITAAEVLAAAHGVLGAAGAPA